MFQKHWDSDTMILAVVILATVALAVLLFVLLPGAAWWLPSSHSFSAPRPRLAARRRSAPGKTTADAQSEAELLGLDSRDDPRGG